MRYAAARNQNVTPYPQQNCLALLGCCTNISFVHTKIRDQVYHTNNIHNAAHNKFNKVKYLNF